MEDYIQLIVFAAFALFSLISGLLTKNRDKPPKQVPPGEVSRREERVDTGRRTERPRRRQSQPQSTGTLEDILRELTGQPSSRPTPEEELNEERGHKKRDWEEHFDEQREWAEVKKEQVEERFEEASDTLKTAARRARQSPRIADKISLEDDHKRIQPLTVTAKGNNKKKKTAGSIIARSLQDPRSAKRAIILSEILQRKHF